MPRLPAYSVAFVWLLSARTPSAYQRELEVALDIAQEFLPHQVCIDVEAITENLDRGGAVAPQSRACPEQCYQASPLETGYSRVCRSLREADNTPPNSRMRQLLLKMRNVRLERFEVDPGGTLLRLELDYSQDEKYAPILQVLGGSYHRGNTQPLSRSLSAVSIEAVPRCVERMLRFPPAPVPEGCTTRLNGSPVVGFSPSEAQCLSVDESAVPGQEVRVALDRCGTKYMANAAFPPPAPIIDLSTYEFSFHWQRSCFLPGAAEQAGSVGAVTQGAPTSCPSATLARFGTACDPCKPPNADTCCYTCKASSPIEFPTPVQFRAASDTQPALDALTWQGLVLHPGDEINDFVPSAQRRIVLFWPERVPAGSSWQEPGREIDSVRIFTPGGRVQEVLTSAHSSPELAPVVLSMPGLQCLDPVNYRYVGRWPYKLRVARRHGDTLYMESPEETRRNLSIALRAHAGAFLYSGAFVHPGLDREASWSPFFDVELAALIYGGWEASTSVMFGMHPSSSTFLGNAPSTNWELNELARVLVGAGRTWYFRDSYYDVGMAFGVAFPALATSWKDTDQYPIGALRGRAAYEITRSLAIELGGWLLYPEEYIVTVQDAAGPRAVHSELALGIALSAGLQWANAF